MKQENEDKFEYRWKSMGMAKKKTDLIPNYKYLQYKIINPKKKNSGE